MDGGIAHADFDIGRAVLTLNARTIRTTAGAVTLAFSTARLDADIKGSGACTLLGLDLCDALAGTDRLVRSGVQDAVTKALNAPSVQAAVSGALMAGLKPLTSVRSIAMYNSTVS